MFESLDVSEMIETDVREMEVEFRRGNFEAGVIEGIEAASRHLARHFPKHGSGRNELPDAPVVI